MKGDSMTNYPTYLVHHGIRGQKWGKRNGPPYPLDASDHSSSERKEGIKGWSVKAKKEAKPLKRSKTTKQDTDTDGKSKKGLTDKQKKALKIGAAAAGVAVVAIGGAYLYKTGKLDGIIERGKSAIEGSGLGGSKENNNPKSFIKSINPLLHKDAGHQYNCGNCAIAFELNSRGRKCSAGYNDKGMTLAQLVSYFKGATSDSIIQMDNVDVPAIPWYANDKSLRERGEIIKKTVSDNIIKKYKEDDYARGTLFLPSSIYGSHYVSWVKNGNEVTYYNSQDVDRDLLTTYFGTYTYIRNNIDASLTAVRLDNLEINNEQVKEVVKFDISEPKFNAHKLRGPNYEVANYYS